MHHHHLDSAHDDDDADDDDLDSMDSAEREIISQVHTRFHALTHTHMHVHCPPCPPRA
jgi:hypothetical protein